ncbi:MAG: MFS transporter [Gammaproteobacteria bacterium]|nr:MFS transporter [Gammaproteobacteria bacterium]
MNPVKPSANSYRLVLLSACALLILSFGYRAGFGLLIVPMSETRGWGRDVLAMALGVQNLVWGISAIIAGGLADRFGNLRVLLVGVCCYAIGMLAMSVSTTELQIMSSAVLMVGAGIAGSSFGIVLPSIARAVPEERRGWAIGIGTAAGSAGQFLVVPVVQFAVDWVGWMYALQLMGLSGFLMAVFCLPLAKYSGVTEQTGSDISQPGLMSIAIRAFSVESYRLLIMGFFVCGFHLAFITVHLPAYLVDLGFSAQIGAWSISLIGLFNIVGAYYSGIISGKSSMRKLLAWIYIGRAITITLFISVPISLPSIMTFSAAMGFLWLATIPPTSGLVAVFFGTRYMSFLYGIVFLSHQLGSFAGVWLGGWWYEAYGNYQGLWIAGIILAITAALLHWPIVERDFSARLKPATA